MGKWYVMWRTKGTMTPDAAVLELSPGKDEHVIAKYSGFRYRLFVFFPSDLAIVNQVCPI